jgi:LysR family glycine cleavage system transcriptional activator
MAWSRGGERTNKAFFHRERMPVGSLRRLSLSHDPPESERAAHLEQSMPQLPNTKLLQAFEATARHGSISVASKELFITQSAMSRQIKALENLLNLELFVRQKNRLVLTDTGRILYATLDKSLREIALCTANLQKGLRRIDIMAPPSFGTCWLAPRLALFYAENKCLISLHTDSGTGATSMQEYDCEIIFGHSNAPIAGAKILFEEHIQPACSPALLGKIKREGIDSVPVLHTLSGITPLPYWDFWILSNRKSPYVPSPSSIMAGMEFSTQQQAINAAIEGLGVVMVDANIASQALKKKHLIALADPVVTPFRYWIVAHANNDSKSTLVKRFCQWLESESLKSSND